MDGAPTPDADTSKVRVHVSSAEADVLSNITKKSKEYCDNRPGAGLYCAKHVVLAHVDI